MKSNKLIVLLYLLFFSYLFLGWTYTYNTATPAGTDNPAEADDRIRETKTSVQERMNIDHYWPLTGTEVNDPCAGWHRLITFKPLTGTEVNALDANYTYIFYKGSDRELYFDSNVTTQITKDGYLNLDDSRLSNETWLIGKSTDATNINLIKVGKTEDSDANVAILPNTVCLDANTAPTKYSQVTSKKYVDDQIAANAVGFGTLASGSVTFGAVSDVLTTDGFLTILMVQDNATPVELRADSSNPPTTVAASVMHYHVGDSTKVTFTVPLKSGWRWQLAKVSGATVTATYRWIPLE